MAGCASGKQPGWGMTDLSLVLVDDEADLRELVRETLRVAGGFSVVGEAANGEDAVALVREMHPDMVLLDLDMPVLSGLDALPRLREASPETRVVVLSGLQEDGIAERSRAGGAVGFLEKGIRARDLVRELLLIGGVLDVVDSTLKEISAHLPPQLDSPRIARRLVARALEEWDCAAALDTVVLLVSEVVGNAVVHAATDVQVAVRLFPHAIRIEATDASPAPIRPRHADVDAESGRGLQLVQRLSSTWGEERTAAGKTVWFEVPRLDGSGDDRLIR